MSLSLHGIGAGNGVMIGRAHLHHPSLLSIPHYRITPEQVDAECARFNQAHAAVRQELETLHQRLHTEAPSELSALIGVHLMILNDAPLKDAPIAQITTLLCNAEWALHTQTAAITQQFNTISDAYLRERRNDILQTSQRLMRVLLGQTKLSQLPTAHNSELRILIAHDLSPAEVIDLNAHGFSSFVTDLGGATSHSAIVARSLNIPCVVALHHALLWLQQDDLVIVDGNHGVLIIDPDPQVLAEYTQRQAQQRLTRQQLATLRDIPAQSIDGQAIRLHANIERPSDVAGALAQGATGIGLFRSEFLFLNRRELPDEEEQFEAYRQALTASPHYPVTIRTYDLGADKTIAEQLRTSANPALGLRAIRLCLSEPKRFLIQLRALYRASPYGQLKILIPMLMSASEIDQTLSLIAQAKASLVADGLAFNPAVPIGAMVEIPAAALALDLFTKRFDFLSVGTNDLLQYLLAIDRTDNAVAHLYDPLHPAVLFVLAHIFKHATNTGTPFSICGEMAGDVRLTRLLLGLGLREFSMHATQLPEIKQRILHTDIQTATPLAQQMLLTSDPQQLHQLLEQINH